jgi:hypothetical protein
MENQSRSHASTPVPVPAATHPEGRFAPLHAYIERQFGGPREAARQFQEIMDEMVVMATMKEEYVCNEPYRFATMYGHLQLLRDALEACEAGELCRGC